MGDRCYAAKSTTRETGANVAIEDHNVFDGFCVLRGRMPTNAILCSPEVASLPTASSAESIVEQMRGPR